MAPAAEMEVASCLPSPGELLSEQKLALQMASCTLLLSPLEQELTAAACWWEGFAWGLQLARAPLGWSGVDLGVDFEKDGSVQWKSPDRQLQSSRPPPASLPWELDVSITTRLLEDGSVQWQFPCCQLRSSRRSLVSPLLGAPCGDFKISIIAAAAGGGAGASAELSLSSVCYPTLPEEARGCSGATATLQTHAEQVDV